MPEAPDWQQSWRKRAQVALISWLGYPLLRVLGATWRWRVEGEDHLRSIQSGGGQAIHAFWHGRILAGTVHFRHRGIVVITSENYDGEWIARIIKRFGFLTARGSTSRGGVKALLQLVREVQAKPVAFTLDGPRGPARVAQPGATWLSKASGNPLLPFHAEASSCWSLRTWDRTQIPKPFATIALVMAEPLQVPRQASDTELEEWRLKLERALAECETRCQEIIRSPDESPARAITRSDH